MSTQQAQQLTVKLEAIKQLPEFSIALKHKKRVLMQAVEAEIAKLAVPTGRVATAQAEIKKDTLVDDVASLHGLNADDRTALKKRLIEKYRDTVNGYLEQDSVNGIELVYRWLIWYLDINGLQATAQLALTAIAKGCSNTQGMHRNCMTWYTDQVFEYSNALYKDKKQDLAREYLLPVIDKLESKEWQDVNPAAASKCYKLAGDLTSDTATALNYFKQAQALNPKAGCIKKIEKKLNAK